MNIGIKTNTAGSGSSSPLLIAGQCSHFICANTKLNLSNRAEQPTDYPTMPQSSQTDVTLIEKEKTRHFI